MKSTKDRIEQTPTSSPPIVPPMAEKMPDAIAVRIFRDCHRVGVIVPVESTMKSGPSLTGFRFGVTGCGLRGLDSYSLISCSRKRASLISA